ncbi:MAG: thioesterase family protein [Dehalococcoidia bacterium]
MGNFEIDTRVEGADGRYHMVLSEDWRVWGPAGGYVAAIALRAAGMEAKIKRPASFSGHFLRMGNFHEVELEVTPVHAGRRSESINVVMRQDGRPIFHALVRTAAASEGLEHNVAKMPGVPEPRGLKTWPEIVPPEWAEKEPPYPFWLNVESRIMDLDRALEGLEREMKGLPDLPGPPERLDWYRFIPQATFEDAFVDAARSLLFMDILAWPAAARPHPHDKFQAPNLDVTCWFHEPGYDSEFLLVQYECPTAKDALMNASGRVWSEDGRLLATGGAQLLCVPIGAGVPPP